MPSPTSRSLEVLRAHGFKAAVVERWNPHARIRQDLFGFADILAMKAGAPLLAIQACADDGGAMAARMAKLDAEPNVAVWLEAGGAVEVWGWGRRSPGGAPLRGAARRARAARRAAGVRPKRVMRLRVRACLRTVPLGALADTPSRTWVVESPIAAWAPNEGLTNKPMPAGPPRKPRAARKRGVTRKSGHAPVVDPAQS